MSARSDSPSAAPNPRPEVSVRVVFSGLVLVMLLAARAGEVPGIFGGVCGLASVAGPPLGGATADRLLAACRDLLAELVAERGEERPPELEALLSRLSRELVGERP